MYFAARQYPELKHLARTKRLGFVAGAIREQNRWIGWRTIFAFFVVVLGSGSVAFLPAPGHVPDWGGTAVAIAGGILFYAYLLWELNGPLLLAVKAYIANMKHAHTDA